MSEKLTAATLKRYNKKELIALVKEHLADDIPVKGLNKLTKPVLISKITSAPKWPCVQKVVHVKPKRKQSEKQKAAFEKMKMSLADQIYDAKFIKRPPISALAKPGLKGKVSASPALTGALIQEVNSRLLNTPMTDNLQFLELKDKYDKLARENELLKSRVDKMVSTNPSLPPGVSVPGSISDDIVKKRQEEQKTRIEQYFRRFGTSPYEEVDKAVEVRGSFNKLAKAGMISSSNLERLRLKYLGSSKVSSLSEIVRRLGSSDAFVKDLIAGIESPEENIQVKKDGGPIIFNDVLDLPRRIKAIDQLIEAGIV